MSALESRTPRERAAALGVDLDALTRTTRTIVLASLAIIAVLLVVVAAPVAATVLVTENLQLPKTTADLATGAMAAFTVAVVSLFIVQIALRVARRASVATQQTALSIVESVVEVGGLFAFAVVFRDMPGAMVGLVCGSVLRATIQALGALSILVAVSRNAKGIEWMLEQHRSLPKGSTTLDYEPWPIVSAIGAQAFVSIGIATLVWVHPPIVVALEIVVRLIHLATNALIARSAQSGAWLLWGYGVLQLIYVLIAAR